MAPYEATEDFSTSSLVKEKGENLTSDRLSKLSIEQMVKTVLAKSGLVSFTRVLRILSDALVLQGNHHLLQKDVILNHLLGNSTTVLQDSQTFVAESSLVYPGSKRKAALRDAIVVALLKGVQVDVA